MMQVMDDGPVEDECRGRKRRRLPRLKTVVLGTGTLLLIGLAVALAVAIRAAREAAIESCSQCPLNQMHLALSNYHATYGCFPPAYVADKDGKPMHSWRVLILPMIEEQAMYATYRFDEPWDGPNNSKLMNKMPQSFHVCSEPASTSVTNLVVITGPGTAFPGSSSTREEDFADGLNNTILLAEIANSDINWLEPRDLDVGQMSFLANEPSRPSISTSRRTGPYVVFADRITAHRLTSSLSEETLQSLTTIAGGEKMFVAKIADHGLTSPFDGPATDEKIGQLDLDRLWSLWLSRSNITDDALAHLAAAPGLSRLYLRSTRITDEGLRHFQQGPPLHVLDLSHTAVGDDGLRHLAGLTRRRYPSLVINLEGSRVTISGVAQFLKSLLETGPHAETWMRVKEGSVSQTCLFYGGSTMTDAQIECFHGFSGIRHVDLSKTQITDAGLKVVASLPDLAYLDVPGTRITDRGLVHLKGLTHLQGLNLSHTEVTGSGLEHIAGLAQLRVLELGGTRVTDSGLKEFRGFSQLHWLDLKDTTVTDSALEYLKGVFQLQSLDIRGTRVTDEGVKKLQQMLPNCRILN